MATCRLSGSQRISGNFALRARCSISSVVYKLSARSSTLGYCSDFAWSRRTSAMPDARLVDSKTTFNAFNHILDARILRALADMGFARPTLVQTKAIPLALENRDILARARTGSGKTAAYCIPIVQKVLNAKSVSPLSWLAHYFSSVCDVVLTERIYLRIYPPRTKGDKSHVS